MNRIILIICILATHAQIATMEVLPPAMVTLQGQSKTFQVPRGEALRSGMLAGYLHFMSDQDASFPLSSDFIDQLWSDAFLIMNQFYEKRDLKGKCQLDHVWHSLLDTWLESMNTRDENGWYHINAQTIARAQQRFPDLLALFRVFDFLDYKKGLQLLARKIVANELLFSNVQDMIKKQEIGDTATKEIARYYYLLRNNNMPGVDENSYGFSIRDYLDFQPERIPGSKEPHYVEGAGPDNIVLEDRTILSLSARSMRINDLKGLESIPYAANCTSLCISSSQVCCVDPCIFEAFKKLKILSFSNNRIRSIPNQFLPGFSQLNYLSLSNNDLRELDPSIFLHLSALQELDLRNNKLRLLPPKIFSECTTLKKLLLAHNELQDLPETLVQGLTNLERLYCASNKINSVPTNILAGLNNLEVVEFSDNPISELNSETFNRWSRLKYLHLWDLPLSDDNKQQIKSALPSRAIIEYKRPKWFQ